VEGKVFNANLQGTNIKAVNLQAAKNLEVQQLSKVKTVYQVKLDLNIEKEVKENYPHLLEKPKEEE
jgi:hypothetical protein